MICIKIAWDIIEDVGPGMRYSSQGHRCEGCRSSSSMYVMTNADAFSVSLRSPLILLIW